MAEPLLQVEGLGRRFDISRPWLNRVLEGGERQFLTAVADVDMTINRGETFALVGESGSGKSTIARMIVGLLEPTTGQITFDGTRMDGTDGSHMRALRSRFQMIFQDPFASLNPRWRVGDIIAEPIHRFGLLKGAAVSQRVGELLDTVGLSASDADKYPHEFSGGQRQRVAIARALSSKPEFIVCDEPTSALDVSVQAQILNLMRDLQDAMGLTYLFISHDLSVVRHMATRIGVLYLGRLVEVAEGKTLFRAPSHPYTRMLLDAVPDLELSGRRRQQVEGEIPNPIDPPSGCAFHPRCPRVMDRCRREVPGIVPTESGTAACFAVEPAAAASYTGTGSPLRALSRHSPRNAPTSAQRTKRSIEEVRPMSGLGMAAKPDCRDTVLASQFQVGRQRDTVLGSCRHYDGTFVRNVPDPRNP
jgi:oligopeptide/dipeptide ABC transporter ATP-binding protein